MAWPNSRTIVHGVDGSFLAACHAFGSVTITIVAVAVSSPTLSSKPTKPVFPPLFSLWCRVLLLLLLPFFSACAAGSAALIGALLNACKAVCERTRSVQHQSLGLGGESHWPRKQKVKKSEQLANMYMCVCVCLCACVYVHVCVRV